jgi:hypothetical protein
MPDLTSELINKIESLVGKWTSYTAFATFVLYLVGYLTLRFQLSVYGIATNLDVFDEKYLFAGCRFLVYLVSEVPVVLLVMMFLSVIFYLPYLFWPVGSKTQAGQWVRNWTAKPNRLLFIGILLAMGLIQFVMRNCFVYGSLLLKDKPPEHEWINGILLTSVGNRSLYFSGLLAGTLLSAAVLLYAIRSQTSEAVPSKVLVGLLIFLVVVELLLLPVNYGTLIASQSLPRVSEIGDEKLPEGSQAWLVWENKEVLTYFVLQAGNKKMLLTVPRKDAKLRIVADDRIFCVLFSCN